MKVRIGTKFYNTESAILIARMYHGGVSNSYNGAYQTTNYNLKRTGEIFGNDFDHKSLMTDGDDLMYRCQNGDFIASDNVLSHMTNEYEDKAQTSYNYNVSFASFEVMDERFFEVVD